MRQARPGSGLANGAAFSCGGRGTDHARHRADRRAVPGHAARPGAEGRGGHAFRAGPDSGGAAEALDPRRAVGARPTPRRVSSPRPTGWRPGTWGASLSCLRQRSCGAVAPTRPSRSATSRFSYSRPLRRDAAHRIPRAARALFATPRAWWPVWKIAAAALVALLLLWLIARWWRRRPGTMPPGADPFAEAMRGFEALDRLGLLDAGEPGRYIALATDITRTYLVRRLAPASMAFSRRSWRPRWRRIAGCRTRG